MVATETFLTALFADYPADPSLRVEIRRLSGERRGGISDWYPPSPAGLSAASRFSLRHGLLDSGWDCFFGVLPRHGNTRKDADIPYATTLFADVDGGADGQEGAQRLLLAAVRSGKLPRPSYAVATGGGIHAYWPLSHVLEIPDEEAVRRFRETEQRLCRVLCGTSEGAHADGSATNVGRILRVPGTHNNKPTRRSPVRLWRFRPDEERHSWQWWEGFLPFPKTMRPPKPTRTYDATARGLPQWIVDWMRTPTLQGQMNKDFTSVAAWMKRDLGLSREVVQSVLETKALCCSPRPEQRRIEEIAQWA